MKAPVIYMVALLLTILVPLTVRSQSTIDELLGNQTEYNGKVLMTGTFHCEPDTIYKRIYGHGHMDIWPAELINVTMIKELN